MRLLSVLSLGFPLALGVLGACVRTTVSKVGTTDYPPKPKGCPVEMFPSTTPGYPWKDIASVEAQCYGNARQKCIDELQEQTCKLGGDTLYAFKDGMKGEYTVVIATVAIREPGELVKTGGVPPASPPADGCSPPCSPGYQCQDAQCVALCNPPCSPGYVCNPQRICEAAAAVTPAPAPTPSPPPTALPAPASTTPTSTPTAPPAAAR